MHHGISRRACLQALLLLPFAARGQQPDAPRIVAINWAAAETLLTLNITPLAISDSGYFRRRIARPALPASVQDIGPFWEPNLELLQALRPSLIISDALSPALMTQMRTIAPLETVPVYPAHTDVWQALADWTQTLAQRFAVSAEPWLQQAGAEMAGYRARLRMHAGASVLVTVLSQDGRHVTIYGANSLADAVLRQLGLVNAWQTPVSPMGLVTHSIEQVALTHCDWLFYSELPTTLTRINRTRQRDLLWQQLPPVVQGFSRELQHFFPFGGMATALMLARQITAALTGQQHG